MNSNQIQPAGYSDWQWRAQSERSTASPSTRASLDAEVNAVRDRVELSPESEAGDSTSTAPALEQRIRAIREQIAAGTYLTPEKIDAAVERLHDELFGE